MQKYEGNKKIKEIVDKCGIAVAKTMTDCIGVDIRMTESYMGVMDVKSLSEQLLNREKEVICSWFLVEGDVAGIMMFILEAKSQFSITDMNEIHNRGETIIQSYINACKTLVDLDISITYSKTLRDSVSAILETTMVEYITDSDGFHYVGNTYAGNDESRYYSLFLLDVLRLRPTIEKRGI